ncbi:hypothetical protein BKA66DRAFT_604346 [Pyrenochaeta sp. MPI-SDFR-AT-0127]|nr:hypothetical protein BKA66DRAFT_604346 [Pyrenochaeta sp. MPI-SDFR-AT-0127]
MEFCASNRCQNDFGLCSELPAISRSTVATFAGAGISTITKTMIAKETQTFTQTVTLPRATVVSTLTKEGDQFTLTAWTTMTLPGENRLVTVTKTSVLPGITLLSTMTRSLLATVTTTSVLEAVTETVTELPTEVAALLGGLGATVDVNALGGLADLNLGLGIPAASPAVKCPTGSPVVNGGFEAAAIAPWTLLSAGSGTFGRAAGGASGSSNSYRFAIDATNPNLPQRLIQPVLLCPGSTYTLAAQTRRTLGVGTIVVTGGIQFGSGTFVQLVGSTVTSIGFTPAAFLTTLTVPSGKALVAGILVFEVTFYGATGAKEVFIDEVTLTRSAQSN